MLMSPLLLADYAGYVDVSDRSEIQFRTTRQFANPVFPTTSTATGGATTTPTGGATPTPVVEVPVSTATQTYGLDFFTQPQVRLRMTNRRLEFTFAYMPSLTLTDLELGTGAQHQVLHAGQVAAVWHADRQVTFGVSEDATYGQFNSENLLPVPGLNMAGSGAPTTTGATQPPPTGTGTTTMTGANAATLQPHPATITLVSTRTTANVGIQADRRTHVTVEGAYYTTGGLGVDSQVNLPLQYGPSADASVTRDLSRRDFSITTARAYSSQFVSVQCTSITGDGSLAELCRPHDDVAQVTQGFNHNFERTTSLTAEAGVSFVRSRTDDDQPSRSVWFPTGRVTVTHRAVPREAPKGLSVTKAVNETQAVLQLAPLINPLTGTITNFLEGQALVSDRIAPTVGLRAFAVAGQAIPTGGLTSSTIIQGEVELEYAVNKQVDLAFGERAFWQRQAVIPNEAQNVVVPPGTPVAFGEFFTAITYFAVTVRAPELRF